MLLLRPIAFEIFVAITQIYQYYVSLSLWFISEFAFFLPPLHDVCATFPFS